MHVYLDGEFVEERRAVLRTDDAGLLRGEGVFETVRVTDGRPLDLASHLDRLAGGMQLLRITVPEGLEGLAEAARRLSASAALQHGRMRLTVTAGHDGVATRLITLHAWQPPETESRRQGVAAVAASAMRIDSGSPLRGIKCTSYALYAMAARAALEAGAFEALLPNERGELAEGSRCNVFVMMDGSWVTPPLRSGCLPGVARARLLDAGLAIERDVPMPEVVQAAGMLLCNSMIGVLPVASIDGMQLPVDATAIAWNERLEKAWQRG